MLNAIVDISIRRRTIVLTLAAALMALGVRTAMRAKLDVFPDFVQPQAVIQTEAPGFSPEQVEALVTRPVEGAIGGVSNLESVRSQSIQGLSIVTVVFREGTDIFIDRQLINENLSAVIESLPSGVKPPRLTPLTSSTMDLLKIGLVSDDRSLMQLRAFADWTLKPRLQAVTGVAQVGVMGGETRQLQIQIDPQRLAAFGVTVNDLIGAARRSTGVRASGFIETDAQRIVLQSEGQSLTEDRLGEVVVRRGPEEVVRLKDVANVCEAAAPKFGDVLIQGRSGVLVKVMSQYGANTMEVTQAVEAALEEMKPLFEAEHIQAYPRMHRPATFIETALHHVGVALLIGGSLVIAVLLLFLFNLRTAVISIVAIPLSLLTAIIALDWLGYSLNTITLGGLAIAIGEVVDDAIIDVENIYRRLRENNASRAPAPVANVIHDASVEVRSAVVYATFVVVMVFVPVLTMSGLQGRMFAPLGVAYILSILASLAVALTVTPAMSRFLLAGARSAGEPRLLVWVQRCYGAALARMMGWRRALIAAGLVVAAIAVVAVRNFGEEFLPEFREGHFVVQVNSAPGVSLRETMRLGERISNDLLTNVLVDNQPVIATIEQQAGRAELGEDPWGPHRSELHIELRPDIPGAVQSDVQQRIRERLSAYPGIDYEVLTFLGDRISETLTGETAPVVVSLFGDNLDTLDSEASRIAREIGAVSGAEDVRVASPPGAPQMLATLRPDRLQAYGFAPLDVLATLQTALQGEVVAQTFEGARVHDVVVTLRPELRRDPESIGDLLIPNAAGQFVPLRELADLDRRTTRYMILHDAGRRRQGVTCSVAGRDIGSFVDEVKRRISNLNMPPGMYVTYGGASEASASARTEIFIHAGLIGVVIVLLLGAVFRNLRNLLLVLANLPFAFVGGVLAVFLTGATLSIGSIVGFVTLFGITMRNSVMLMSHYEHLVTMEGQAWGMATALRGASERVVPILMTALVTGLGLAPIALGSGEVGREIEGPMAIVILGGLITSTILNLLVLPVLALRYARFDTPDPEAPHAAVVAQGSL
ncbi:MAG TPA: efflux RND transporter permease subunit [Phycisphaerae bacterium]|nr:efflux RND transporter permease subunit [Phycisphaerae bacterium]HRW55556.1 efflux RND transporter permease subunit [Phycisphaerae bacterium]